RSSEPADLEAGRLAEARVYLRHVDRHAARSPHVVVVDPGRHHEHERGIRTDLWDLDLSDLERFLRLAEAFGADHLRVHARRDLAERRNVTDLVDARGHRSSSRTFRKGLSSRARRSNR